MFTVLVRSLRKLRLLAANCSTVVRFSIASSILCVALAGPLYAEHAGKFHGEIRDPLGDVVANASVELIRNDRVVASTKANAEGAFAFDIQNSGRYSVRAAVPSFQATTSSVVYLSAIGDVELNVTLGTPVLTQQVPNRNLLGAYRRLELGGGWQSTLRVNFIPTSEPAQRALL